MEKILDLLNEIKILKKEALPDFDYIISNYDFEDKKSDKNVGMLLKDFKDADYEDLLEHISYQFHITKDKKYIKIFFDFLYLVVSEKSYIIIIDFLDIVRQHFKEYDNHFIYFQNFVLEKYFIFQKIIDRSECLEHMLKLKQNKVNIQPKNFDNFISFFGVERVFQKNDFYFLIRHFDTWKYDDIIDCINDYVETGSVNSFNKFSNYINNSTLAMQHKIMANLLYKINRELYQSNIYKPGQIKKDFIMKAISIVKPKVLEYMSILDERFKFNNYRLVSLVNILYTMEVLYGENKEQALKDLIVVNSVLNVNKIGYASPITFNRTVKNTIEIENILIFYKYFNQKDKYTQVNNYISLLSKHSLWMSFLLSDKDQLFNNNFSGLEVLSILEGGSVFNMLSLFEKGHTRHTKNLVSIGKEFVKDTWEIMNPLSEDYFKTLGFDYISKDITP